MLWVLGFYLVTVFCFDFFTLRIPNRLTLGLMPVFLAYRIYIDSWVALADILLTIMMILCLFLLAFQKNYIGAGDIKFLISSGILIGTKNILGALPWAGLISLPFLLYLVIKYRERFSFFLSTGEILSTEGAIKVPYVCFLALGITCLIFMGAYT